MRSSLWLVNMGFVPRTPDLAVLLLRVTLGISMLALHGWGKLIHFPTTVAEFPDPIGVGRHFSLGLAIFSELFCSALLVLGILTRFSALVLLINMGVVFFLVHHGSFAPPGAELSAIYMFGYAAILLAGGGRFSADGAGGPYALAGLAAVAGAVLGYPLSYYFQSSAYKDSVSQSTYLAGFKEVLSTDSTKLTALGVWAATVVILAVGGFLIGRAMARRSVRVIETTDGPVTPVQ